MVLARFPLALALCATAASAQLPATPDGSRYPQLAAMKQGLESGSEPAHHCARSGGLFTEASEAYRVQRSEPGAVATLMLRHGEKLDAANRERLRETVTQMAAMAAGLADLAADDAPIAYAQLCIGRAQRPNATLDNAAIKTSFEAAMRCERSHPPGTLDRKECVATAFRVR